MTTFKYPLKAFGLSTFAITFYQLVFTSFAYSYEVDDNAMHKGNRRSSVIEEVVVTAQKRTEVSSDVPIAISAFTGESLAQLNASDIQAVSRLVPGLNANESGGITIFSLRGVGFNDTTYTSTGTVGLYLNEINMPYSPMVAGPSFDIDRLEVLKGPQGTLYGRNTTGGIINYIPKSPTMNLEMGLKYSYSEFETSDTEVYVSGPLSDTISARMSGRVIKSDEGWQRSISRPDDSLGKQDKTAARIIVDWDVTDKAFLRFMANGWRNKGDSQAAQPIGIQPQNPFFGEDALHPRVRDYPYVSDTDDPTLADWVPLTEENSDDYLVPERNDKFTMFAIDGTYNFSETMQLKILLSSLNMEADGSAKLTTGLDVHNVDTDLFADIQTDAIEVRLSDLAFDSKLKWAVGINASKDDAVENNRLYFHTISLFSTPSPTPYTNLVSTHPVLNGEPEINQKAIFVNTDTDLTENITLTLAARYTEQEQDYYSCSYESEDSAGVGLNTFFTALTALQTAELAIDNPGALVDRILDGNLPFDIPPRGEGNCYVTDGKGQTPPFREELDESNTSWRTALRYISDSENTYFASVSRGYKAGGFPVLNASSTAQYVPVTQEELTAYELGAKLSFLDKKVRADFALFYYDYVDKQLLTRLSDPILGPLPVLLNAPESEVYGAEFDVKARPIQGLLVAAVGSWLKSEVKEFSGTDFNGNDRDFAGQPFNFSPEKQATLLVEYSYPFSSGMDVGVGFDYTYSSDTNGTLEGDPRYKMDSWYQVGARAYVAQVDGVWDVSIWGRNITNEHVSTGVFNLGDTVVRYTAMPRVYGITFSYNYL